MLKMCFGRPLTSARTPARRQRARQRADRLRDERLALDAALVEHLRDALVQLRLEEAERQVLELPLQLPHAETVRERRVDVQRLARHGATRLVRRVREEAQRLRAAREADEHDPDVLDHREEHLAQHLGLRLPGGLLLALRGEPARHDPQAVQLPDAGDERGDRGIELRREPLLGILEVLGHGIEEARRACRAVQPQRREVRGQAQRVIDRRLAGAESPVRVERRGELVRAQHERAVGRVEPGECGLEAGLDDGAGSGCDGNHCGRPSNAGNVTGRP